MIRDLSPPAECGHPQPLPTAVEMANGPEIIVRACSVCERALYWTVDRWRKI